ncbi:MAG: aquaporin [Defluviimonas sp.]|nr:aquaporin [Paracoccaceae bacterium]MCC0064085.1 aquaporin [Defluviimonas sp.]
MMLRRLSAEALGTAFLVLAGVGSAIMAATLSQGNDALALLASAIATGCALYVLITVLTPVSGGHINPAVTLAFLITGQITPRAAAAYVAAQIAGGIVGVWVAHAMFGLEIFQFAQIARNGARIALAEFVATFGLIFVIVGGVRNTPAQVPALVGTYIASAYWFTASTSFANPAVTIARIFTDTPTGILPVNAAAFVAAELLGAALAAFFLPRLFSA